MPEEGAVWTEVSLLVAPEASEMAADVLQEVTGNGVSIEPPIEALGPDEGYTLDLLAPLRLAGYVRGPVGEEQRRDVEMRLEAAGLGPAIRGDLEWSTIREEDWAEAWKQHYDIEKVERLVVRPAWREYEAQSGETVISLDPGMAFGTGQHPTTRMCLEALQAEAARGSLGRGLDLGSGSGILAIAAVALGAESIIATDTEEQAVKATIANVALNGMADRIETRPGSIEAVAGDGPFDFILANINAAAIAALAADLVGQLKPGAWLAAGGIIAEREAAPREALETAGLRIESVMQTGDWRTFIARK